MNITIGDYETENFDICSLAAESFGALANYTDDIDMAQEAAELVDKALGILKQALLDSAVDDDQIDKFEEYISDAEVILDEMGEIDNHDYLRDVCESQLMGLYEVDDAEIDAVIADEDDAAELDPYDEHPMDADLDYDAELDFS